VAQITTGIRSILSIPFVYNTLQRVLGVTNSEKTIVKEYMSISSNDSILDIGCATAVVLDFMPKDIKYTGFDISSQYINLAKKKYKDRENTFFFDTYATTDSLNGEKFDKIIFNKVLHHLEDIEVSQLFDLAKHHLKDNGKVVCIDPCFIENQGFISKLIVSNDRGQNVRRPIEYKNLALKFFLDIKTTQRDDLAWIPIDCYIMECKN
jgi:SAM-dependent methyltransferase